VVISLCWWCCFDGDVVVLVFSLSWRFRCAGDFVVLVLFAGAFVVLVILLRWRLRCIGDFVVISLRWWCCCAGGDFVVLVVMLLCWLAVSLWAVDQVPSLSRYARTMHKKRFAVLLQRFSLVVQEPEYIRVRGFHLVFGQGCLGDNANLPKIGLLTARNNHFCPK
jgi:hypothetical protein